MAKVLIKPAYAECVTLAQQRAFFAECNRRRRTFGSGPGRGRHMPGTTADERARAATKVIRTGGDESKPTATEGTAQA